MLKRGCGHELPICSYYEEWEPQSHCSKLAYNACIPCISRFASKIQKRDDYRLKKAQAFVCECICWGKESINTKFKALQFCHTLGFPFPFQIFEFEQTFTKEQTLWLIQKNTPVYCIINQLIEMEWWEHIDAIISPEFNELQTAKKQLLFYFPSSLVAIILLKLLN